MSDIWEVEIVAADRFKTKGFQKPSTWFRVDVALITGSKWRELSANAQRLWMLTLAHGSAKGSLRVALGSTRGISADIRCKPQSIPTAVRELTKLGWLQVLAEPRARAVRTNERTNERTFHAKSPGDLVGRPRGRFQTLMKMLRSRLIRRPL